MAYGTGGLKKVAIYVVLFGVFWITSLYKRWKWCDNIMFLGFAGTCTAGLYFHLSFMLLFLGLVGALSTHDLNRFEQRKSMAGIINSKHGMEKHHLIRLMIVIIISLILGTITSFISIRIEFGMVLSLGILIVFCMNRVTTFLIHKND